MQRDTHAELHVCFRRAYDATLQHHHGFLVRKVVTVGRQCSAPLSGAPQRQGAHGCLSQVAIRAVPHRRDFYARLTEGTSHEKFDAELAKWLSGLEGIVDRMRTFLEQGGYGKV